jgi:negative regulator of flagellin synthesis FlgM
MKIDGSNRAATLTGNTAPAPRGSKSSSSSSTSTSQDSVTISSTSSQLQALETGVNEASGFDSAKVEAIKQAISEGRYTINPEAIADKLISSTREFLSQQTA